MCHRHTIALFYITLFILSPTMTTAFTSGGAPVCNTNMAISLASGFLLWQLIQMALGIFDVIDDVTGNRITGAFSWTFNLIGNATKTVTGTVPIPAIAFLAYKFPTAVQKIAKRLDIEIKDIPKIILNRRDKPNIKRWRRF